VLNPLRNPFPPLLGGMALSVTVNVCATTPPPPPPLPLALRVAGPSFGICTGRDLLFFFPFLFFLLSKKTCGGFFFFLAELRLSRPFFFFLEGGERRVTAAQTRPSFLPFSREVWLWCMNFLSLLGRPLFFLKTFFPTNGASSFFCAR